MIVLELVCAGKQIFSPTPNPRPNGAGESRARPQGGLGSKGEPLWGGVGSLLVRVNGAGEKIFYVLYFYQYLYLFSHHFAILSNVKVIQ